MFAGCGSSDPPIERSAELRGFSPADLEEIIERGRDTSFDSRQEELEDIQIGAQGWAACRDVYEVYDHLVRAGELLDAPEPAEPARKIDGTAAVTEDWIELLYAPLREGDLAGFREFMSDDFAGCGDVPVNATGDRSLEIAGAVAAWPDRRVPWSS
jgi:hypothetical protein